MRRVDWVTRLLGSYRGGTVWIMVVAWAGLSAVLLVEADGMTDSRQRAVAVVASALLAGAFVVARRSPAIALILVGALALAQVLVSVVVLQSAWAMSCLLPVIVFAFHAGRRSVGPLAVVGLVIGAATVSGSVLAAQWMTGRGADNPASVFADWAGVVIVAIMVALAPWLLGRYWRDHDAIGARGWEVAEHLERVRTVETEHARLRERARIASDMHDSLGHSLTLVGVRAAALEMAAEADSDQRAAASELRAAAHEATLRLREVIGVLRSEHSGDDEATVDDVSTLVRSARSAGLRVRLTREGLDLPTTTPVGAAACRVVREALTNAARYAADAEITVRVSRDGASTSVLVQDDGSWTVAAGAGSGSGTGLAGLRERVEELRGTLDAGPVEDGPGFRVRAWLPESDDTASQPRPGTRLTRERENVTRRARRGLLTAVLVPVGLTATLAGLTFALLGLRGANSVLDPADYAELDLGDARGSVESVLPAFSSRPRDLIGESPAPDGSVCEYYPSSRESGLPTIFRLCFVADRLVAKDEFEQRP
ncbi:hypothetical protein J4H86_01960 [Spiractinospora alimapuensis]|uniref:sensor histidine kinase n=1 Tax=Spiractinospora alimapuensis TaxID=2820884 RepID=UPI001F16871E|nr:histidine kinase [Spiractinospora alimapuensis]QVQ52626.1 hypothetical protein J4H86_01960 [Spiractinospora alimapuensis]